MAGDNNEKRSDLENLQVCTKVEPISKNKFKFILDVKSKEQLEYAWYIYKDGKKIDQIWYDTKPWIIYDILDDGKYEIKYFIRDKYGNKIVNNFDNMIKSIPSKNDDIKEVYYENLKMAVILDEITYECFKYDCRILRISKENYKDEIEKYKPDLLFVESAWNGNESNWQYIISNRKREVVELVEFCKNKKIPTVFWCKEDPVKYDVFRKTAELFDYIFTTDENCVEKYKKDLNKEDVYPLMFGIQPKIHNPIRNTTKNKLNNICFAGIYYNNRFPEREKFFNMFAEESLKYGLDIYDRFSYIENNPAYMYPDKYKDCLKPYVKYDKLIEIYKRYNLAINLNTVTDSNTMFSRRIFDCLACGTPIISNYSKGVEKYFKNYVGICKNQDDVEKFIKNIMEDKIYRDKFATRGILKVIEDNKYSDRLNFVCSKVGIKLKTNNEKKVSVIVSTNRQENMKRVFDNFAKQTCENKELVIVLNGKNMNLLKWIIYSRLYYPNEDIKIIKTDSSVNLGECLNIGIEKSKYDYIFKMDDDDLYSPNCLKNELKYFDYTDASIIGKNCFYVYFCGSKRLAIKYENKEHKYTNLIAGSCMLFTRQVYNDVKFDNKLNVSEIMDFLRRASQKGYKIFSSSRFDHAVIRNSDMNKHTWQIDEEEYMTKCKLLYENFEYSQLEELIDLDKM